MQTTSSSTRRDGLFGLAAVAPVVACAVLGSIATAPALKSWYPSLAKPFFTPPNWVFGPAWTALYALMAFAFWRILIMPENKSARGAAIVAFVVQLVINALWSVVFFGLRSPGGGLATIFVLWTSIAVVISKFRPLDQTAAWLLAPYLAWTTFAAALNVGVYLLN
ncbi:MAG: tryptophan-rich sensory protein [Hyphomicrobiales bacterium]|nr:tryptophan-rich sensory protein [Hyphomicrobiales bacterium]